MSCHNHQVHHHHHHSNNHHSSCYCHGCNSCCSCSCSSLPTPTPPPPPPPPISDHLLLQTLLLLQPNPQPLKPPKPQHQPHHRPTNRDPQLTQSLLHSLLHRVANLEASLSSIPSPPPLTPPRPTIKHLAAATIQTHFRRFLARRSRTLRDLNRLATVKSHASALRSSLSGSPNPQDISHIAIDLLAQLDAIQSRDPMIREGKRAISRELVRVTEFVDKVLVRESAESGAGRGRSDTRVRFAENGNGGEAFDEMPERVFEISDGDEGATHLENHRFCQFRDDVGLSAPLPVTMEHIKNGSKRKVGNAHST